MKKTITDIEMKLLSQAISAVSFKDWECDLLSQLCFKDVLDMGYSRKEAAGFVGSLCKKELAYTEDFEDVKQMLKSNCDVYKTLKTEEERYYHTIDSTMIIPTNSGVKEYFIQLKNS